MRTLLVCSVHAPVPDAHTQRAREFLARLHEKMYHLNRSFQKLRKDFQDQFIEQFNLAPTILTVWPSPQSTYVCRVKSSVWRLQNIGPPPPPSLPSECVLPPHQSRWGIHTRRAVRGQYFGRRQTLDWPLTV